MITQKQAEEIVKRYSPTTKVSVHNTDSTDGIYLQKTNTISIAHNWSVAGLLHEITHAVLILEDCRDGHDGVFADRFTKIVDDYYGEQIKRLQEQLKEAREVVKFYSKTTVGHKQKDGTYRLSVATGTINFLDPFFGMTSGMQEYVYDPRPAKKYLKKWGVK